MKSQTEDQKTTETKKPRFKIEKLEERIAPGGLKHPGSHGEPRGGPNFCEPSHRHNDC
jgi:hypothetical protein